MRRRRSDHHGFSPNDAVGRMLLGQPELSEQVMRGLELKGDLPQYVDPHFQLGISSLDMADPEYQYLRRQNRYQGGATVAAVAAQFGYLLFNKNGLGRDALAVVERIWIANTDVNPRSFFVFLIQNAAAPGAASGLQFATDDRINGGNVAQVGSFRVGFVQSATDFHPANGALVVAVQAGDTQVLEVPYIISNSQFPSGVPTVLMVQCSSVNAAFSAGLVWRERAVGAPEL